MSAFHPHRERIAAALLSANGSLTSLGDLGAATREGWLRLADEVGWALDDLFEAPADGDPMADAMAADEVDHAG